MFPDDVMFALVEAIIAASEQELVAVFDEVDDQHRVRVERRLKWIVHSDRNSHKNATQAFQLLSNCKWKLKSSKTLLSIHSYCTWHRTQSIISMAVAAA